MIARTLRGLGALALIALALIGWPAALLGLADAVAVWLPDLSDPAALLSRPDTGGLFLVIVLAVGWIAWVVWTVALIVEVAAQVRGVPTPHLGGLFPQNATAALVTAIAVAFTIAPATPAIAGAPAAAPTPAATSVSQTVVDRSAATRHRDPAVTAPTAVADAAGEAEQGDYTVVRGDTLWEIAGEQLDDPTRYPEIVAASETITQPDGRHLTEPDLILPGWTLNVPDETTEQAQAAAQSDEPVSENGPAEVPSPAAAEDSPTPSAPVVPPTTPLSAPASPASTPAGGGPALSAAEDATTAAPAAPGTPMSAAGEQPVDPPDTVTAREAVYDDEGRFAPTHGVLGLPNWITAPLIPTRPEDAPELIAEAEVILARYSAAQAAARAAGDLPPTTKGRTPDPRITS